MKTSMEVTFTLEVEDGYSTTEVGAVLNQRIVGMATIEGVRLKRWSIDVGERR